MGGPRSTADADIDTSIVEEMTLGDPEAPSDGHRIRGPTLPPLPEPSTSAPWRTSKAE